ncbi:MAG: hypothetical protein D6730_03525 [Bacteroidetes bacterium]|nr:MAG: hypothetical protein D6730_03525 [Bacteroidota bacterium]
MCCFFAFYGLQAQPGQFSLLQQARGVALYCKENTGKNPFYICVVDLSQGARLHFLAEDHRTGAATHPYFERKPLETFWTQFGQNCPRAFAMVNGQFFRQDQTHSQVAALALPIKSEDGLRSYGYNNGSRIRKRGLFIYGQYALMRPYRGKPEKLLNSPAPQLLVGLHPGVNRHKFQYIGRTLIGLRDADKDKRYEQILIFSARYASQQEAIKALKRFGAKKIMMLEEGPSAQMICRDVPYVKEGQTIPHAIGVASGD